MTPMSNSAFAKRTKELEREMKKALKSSVDVGIVNGNYGQEIYDGLTVVQVGASHEYGVGDIPQRSFLRMPFDVKETELSRYIASQFKKLERGNTDTRTALGRVGVKARNIVVEAFSTGGFGQWPDISAMTKEAKGSSKILINTSTLRNSITWRVNSDT
jgi:phage gpG-like protein